MNYHVILSNERNNEKEIYNLINNTILDSKIFFVKNYDQIDELIDQDKINYLYIPISLIEIQKIKRINFISLDIKIIYFGNKLESVDLYQTTHLYYINEPYTKDQIQKIYRKGVFELNQKQENVFTIKLKKDILVIPYEEILYMYSNGRYVSICSKYNEHRIIAKLDDIEPLLNKSFYRTHQSFIVNITKIRKLTSKNCYVGKTYFQVPISKGNFIQLKDSLLELYSNQ